MEKIIETQVRLLVGTLVMWTVATIIFGNSLVVYGVAYVIRWLTYIQGAVLLTAGVGWINTTYEVLRRFITYVRTKVLQLRPVKLGVKDLLQEVKRLLKRTETFGSKDEYVMLQFDELLEVAAAIICGTTFKSPVEELNHRFHWENVDFTPNGDEEIVDSTLDG